MPDFAREYRAEGATKTAEELTKRLSKVILEHSQKYSREGTSYVMSEVLNVLLFLSGSTFVFGYFIDNDLDRKKFIRDLDALLETFRLNMVDDFDCRTKGKE